MNGNNVGQVWRQYAGRAAGGTAIAFVVASAGMLLIGISGWFITATALTGLGIISLQTYNLFLPSAIIRFLALLKPPLKYWERLYNHRLTFQIAGITRQWVFRHIFNMDKANLAKFRDIDLTSKITDDINQCDQLLVGLIIPWLSNTLLYTLMLPFLWSVTPVLAWQIFGAYIVCAVVIPYYALKSGINDADEQRKQHELESHLSDHLNGYKELISFNEFTGHSIAASRLINEGSSASRDGLLKKSKIAFLQGVILQGIVLSSLATMFYKTEKPGGPLIILVILIILALLESMHPLADLFYQQAKTIRSAGNLCLNSHAKSNCSSENHLAELNAGYGVTVVNLWFGYGKRILYSGVNLKFSEGSTSVIRGSNGSGKSTLLDLIFGFHQPHSGQIFVKERQSNADFANGNSITYLEQNSVLFNISILDNIAIGNPLAGEKEIAIAAKSAGLGDPEISFPGGLAFLVEEEGKNLSGGQKRMVALARIILRDAAIILLDEPTEGMDSPSRQNFIALINRWHRVKTIIIITHQEFPGMSIDQFVEVDQTGFHMAGNNKL